MPRLGQIPLGGTAVGTGMNTHPEFAEKVRALLHAETNLPISAPADPFEAQAARDGLVELSGALKVVAVSYTKIANDLRFLGSGPRAGLAEIVLPELQKGSSIMPGKVNPVIPEVVTQVSAQVIGNDVAITIGGMNGHFELNVFIPLMARNLLQSITLLASASRLFAEKCVDGIEANREQCESYAELTLSAATALNPFIGYDKASEIVKAAAASGRSLREVAREAGVEESVLDEALDYHVDGQAARLSTRYRPAVSIRALACRDFRRYGLARNRLTGGRRSWVLAHASLSSSPSAAAALIAAAAFGSASLLSEDESESGLPWKAREFLDGGSGEKDREVEKARSSQGVENGGSGGEAFEALTLAHAVRRGPHRAGYRRAGRVWRRLSQR